MNPHPYLRAYMAGIVVPTLVMPLLLTLFIVTRIILQVPTPIERAMIFPMALVPSLFGLWNMLYLSSRAHIHHPIGLHGAVLPLLGLLEFVPGGVLWFQAWRLSYALVVAGFLAAMAAYYLVWKYLVGFLNRVLGIA
jgi:hypothetical protein